MLFQPIRALLNVLRNESCQTYIAYDQIFRLCPKKDIRKATLAAFADLLEEHIFNAWDYEIPHKCQFDVETVDPRGPSDCGEPAPYRIFWLGNEEMWACEEHFNLVRQS